MLRTTILVFGLSVLAACATPPPSQEPQPVSRQRSTLSGYDVRVRWFGAEPYGAGWQGAGVQHVLQGDVRVISLRPQTALRSSRPSEVSQACNLP
ncbi:MAG: hypothetical protein U1F76_22235 [Candidatus Competibacteraceae bacterium]